MSFLRELLLRLRWLLSRSRFNSELADEIQFHIESRAAELEQAGVPAGEALSKARREFGSRRRATEDTSSAWQIQWLEDLFSDLPYAARAFRRNPGFVATAIFCLALGIGANITIFNVTTSFLFSEPSARDSASVIAIWEGGNSGSSLTDYKFDTYHTIWAYMRLVPERYTDAGQNKQLAVVHSALEQLRASAWCRVGCDYPTGSPE